MAAVKFETKVAVLLSPHELGTKYRLLESLHIQKSEKGINYELVDLLNKELNKHYAYLPTHAKELLFQFNPEAVSALQFKFQQSLSNKKAADYENTLITTVTIRHFHQVFDRLKPFASLIKWYHKTRTGNAKNFKTSPASFSNYKPVLQFHVSSEKGRLF